MTPAQRIALANPALLACEMLDPRFGAFRGDRSENVTVYAGYECQTEGWGGPVWHASVGSPAHGDGSLERAARELLAGVGDADAGEWLEYGTAAGAIRVCHLRRRLTDAEACAIGPARDVRGSPEHRRRAAAVAQASGFPFPALLSMD